MEVSHRGKPNTEANVRFHACSGHWSGQAQGSDLISCRVTHTARFDARIHEELKQDVTKAANAFVFVRLAKN